MGSVGTTTPAHSQLGKPGQGLWERYNNSITDAIKSINPNYNTDEKYRKNCALCSAAALLAMRGYDVEAMPRDTEWRGSANVFDVNWKDYDNYIAPNPSVNYAGEDYMSAYYNPNKFKGTYKTAANTIDTQMQKWGTHSAAELTVQWKSGKSHSLIVFREAHTTTVMDFQNGKTYVGKQQIADLLMKRTKPSYTMLVRYDNLPVKSNIKDLNKMVKIKGGK